MGLRCPEPSHDEWKSTLAGRSQSASMSLHCSYRYSNTFRRLGTCLIVGNHIIPIPAWITLFTGFGRLHDVVQFSGRHIVEAVIGTVSIFSLQQAVHLIRRFS